MSQVEISVPRQEFAALHAPVAPFTWEVRSLINSTILETGRIPIHFNQPVEILGFKPTVILSGVALGGTRRIPTTNDLMILFDINQRERLTNRLESTSTAGIGQAYVTLETFNVITPRLIRIRMQNEAPDVGIQYRWSQDPAPGGVPIYESAIVSLAFFCRYIADEE